MADEGFEPYHVPQRSRRDKLRVGLGSCVDGAQQLQGLVPFYDPDSSAAAVLISSSDYLTPSSTNLHHQNNQLCDHDHHNSSNTTTSTVKEEGTAASMMCYLGGSSSSSASGPMHHFYMDPQSSSIQLNPSNATDPFLYARVLDHPPPHPHHDQSFHEVVLYKPEAASNNNNNNSGSNNASCVNNGGGQGLSLSLSSHDTPHQTNVQRPLELNLQRYDSSSSMFSHDKVITTTAGNYVHASSSIRGGGGGGGAEGSTTSYGFSRSSVPLGPFTGYASILNRSRFLKPAQQLLAESCDVARGMSYLQDFATDHSELMEPPPLESHCGSGAVDDPKGCTTDGGEQRRKKSRLISMLDEVYRRYKHYYQQMQAVIASFESVAGLSNAAPFANVALKTLSKHFRCLKNAIKDQLQSTTKSIGHIICDKDEILTFGNQARVIYSPRPNNGTGSIEHQPVWRPQRGLPERAVTVLRAWLFEHFLHPYPTDTDKLMLAKQTGLSRNQVSNWFINARVRLWKPMVEEIHMLETRQAHKGLERDEQNANVPNDNVPGANSITCESPSTSTKNAQGFPSKRTRNDFSEIAMRSQEAVNLSYDNLSRHPHLGVRFNAGNVTSGVSLTLGLHQNNAIGLSEAFPVNAARRFGLETDSGGYAVGGFEADSRQSGRDIVRGQLLHDFVG